MHWLDIIILVILGIGAAMGFCSGLLWQIARVVCLAFSLYVAILSYGGVADWLGARWNVNAVVNHVAAFIAVFLAVYLILYLLTRIANSAIKASKLETADRMFGALLGAGKMAAVVACICGVMTALDVQVFREWFEQATLAPGFARGSEEVVRWIPQAYRDRADEGVQQVRDELQKKITDAAADTIKK